MKSRQRRLKAIELTLTPKQVVVVWLRNALQAGTFDLNSGPKILTTAHLRRADSKNH